MSKIKFVDNNTEHEVEVRLLYRARVDDEGDLLLEVAKQQPDPEWEIICYIDGENGTLCPSLLFDDELQALGLTPDKSRNTIKVEYE